MVFVCWVDILVELGSGILEKIWMLLDVLCYWGLLCRFVLFDVDVSVLLVIVIVI